MIGKQLEETPLPPPREPGPTSVRNTISDDDIADENTAFDTDDAHSVIGVSLGPQQTRLLSPRTPAEERSLALDSDYPAGSGRNVHEAGNATDIPPVSSVNGNGNVASNGVGFSGTTAPHDISNGGSRDRVEHREHNGGQRNIDHSQINADDASTDRGRTSVRDTSSLPNHSTLPSPWRAQPRVFKRSADIKAALQNTDPKTRPRSSSATLLEGLQKSIASSFEGLPKAFAFPGPFSSPFSSRRGWDAHQGRDVVFNNKDRNAKQALPDLGKTRSSFGSSDGALEVPPKASSRPEGIPHLHTSSAPLRRAASDESLQLLSAISRTSLGDDDRFEHVREMVNSRSKAIRDSLQDSNIKLPSLSSLSLQSLQSLRPDFSSSRLNLGLGKPSTPATSSGPSRASSTVGPLSPTESETARNAASVGSKKEGGPTTKAAIAHPHFTKACARLCGDVIVLGGYRGSILRSAEPPHRQLWAPVKVGLNIRKVDLEIGLNVPEDDLAMPNKIFPDGMLSNIGPVDISRRLFHRLRASDNAKSGKLRVHDYGYDWRLDPIVLSQQLIKFLESLPCNQPGLSSSDKGATIIAHSLGGLITRHAVNQRPELFAGVVFAGTPDDCVNILGPLRNGDDVLLSSRILTAQVNFTIRTSFALLPLSGRCFFNPQTREQYPVDFFDPQTWYDHALSPCASRADPVPGANTGLLSSITQAFSTRRLSTVSSFRSSLLPSTTSDSPPSSTPHPPKPTGPLEPSTPSQPPTSSIATQVTLSPAQSFAYLTTVLARVKTFKLALAHDPTLQSSNAYPPFAVIFGKDTPTVYGARVTSRETIRRADAYDNLAFGSGDGVVLARAAQLPDGYVAAKGGLVTSERGHVSLLGDLEAVGRAVNALLRERARGVGLGHDRGHAGGEE